jgi:hypothetical protein
VSDTEDALMSKARQALDDARLLLEHDRAEAAVNRVYYAALDAARAALLAEDETPGSHAGVKTRFSYHFVRTERLPKETARILAEAETMRNRADYDAFAVFETAAAADLLADVERFVDAIDRLLHP